MSSVSAKQTSPGDKPKRSLSGQGGLLQRMFGGSNASKEALDAPPAAEASSSGTDSPQSPQTAAHPIDTISEAVDDESRDEVSSELTAPPRRPSGAPSEDGDKKRRSSGVGKLFSSAKQSLSNLGGSSPDSKPTGPQTPMQKLARSDPALSVPQGSLNNSAGESNPGPRSTFRVGVTEDKNKKCRRTMEDTHAYLYNFISTPSPFAAPEQPAAKKRYSLSLTQTLSRTSTMSDMSASPDTAVYTNKDVVETDNGYFAIFDGHAGTFAADWCGKKVHILLEEHIRRHPQMPIPEVLDMTFTAVDQQLEKLPLKNSGCTAVIAVLRWEDRIPSAQSATGSTAIAPAAAAAAAKAENAETNSGSDVDASSSPSLESKLKESASRQRVLYTANVGDARIVLCRNGKALRLSYDHKGSDENEGRRIAGAGGLILNNRVNGVLAVTRALGDAYMKELVTGHPYTTETVIQPEIDEFMILACDGLWDVCTDQEAVDLIREVNDAQIASKMLVDHALARFSTDNLSCMVVRFDNKAVQQAQVVEEQLIGVEGDAHSKLGNITEIDAIVTSTSTETTASNGLQDPITTTEVLETASAKLETVPELNPAALEAARKDRPAAASN